MSAPDSHPATGRIAPRILFGGTFDPVHEGHLTVARAVRDRFRCPVTLLPAGRPPHRAVPHATAAQRLAMLELALASEPGLAIDDRETRQDGPNWTITTVETLRRELPPSTPLLLVIGMDSLRNFRHWHRWQDILGNAHLVACSRPGEAIPGPDELGGIAACLADDPDDLLDSPGGRVLIERTTAANMTATRIRAALAAGTLPDGLAPAVLDYIRRHHLYRPTEHDRPDERR